MMVNQKANSLRILLATATLPFQVQLVRELASRGHEVHYVYHEHHEAPTSTVTRRPQDPNTLLISGIKLSEPFAKHRFVKRRSQEIQIGRLIAHEIKAFQPDLVISGMPLDCQRQIWRACEAQDCARIFWIQDIYSEAIHSIMSQRIPVVGHAIGWFYKYLEVQLLRYSDHVIVISDDFLAFLESNGIPRSRTSTINNWAPLTDLTPTTPANSVAEEAAETQSSYRPRIIYSGTLGLKHNPNHLLTLAEALPEADIHVFSEGAIANRLIEAAQTRGVHNLQLRPWVSYDRLTDTLSAADILVVLLEETASVFSVPSKLATYACIGRPILGSIPEKNLAHEIIRDNHMGLVATPNEPERLVAHARELLKNAAARKQMGMNARAYARRAFNITTIGDKFEAIFATLRPGGTARGLF